jgi:nicotinamide-nucleotide amidase
VKAEILTIGDELLRGEIVDSNKAFLSDRLFGLDVETRFHVSVGDDPTDMEDAFRRAAERSDIALVSGGLGPTRDDLTIEVLARTFGRELQVDQASLEGIKAFFARFGREMSPNNAKQAEFPEGAEVLPNPIGTAPGCLLEESGTLFFCMPGVPRELERMMDEQVLPRIEERLAGAPGRPVVRTALLRTFGIGESNLDEELADIAREADVSLGFRTSFPDNYLRPVVRAATASEAETKLARVCAAIRERLGPMVYGSDAEAMEEVVGKLLRAQGKTLAVAESCTGGLIGERITDVPGSSEYFLGGVVAYADRMKATLLGVPESLLLKYGAVSEPVAIAMAEGARERFGADLAVSTTGVAGPGGGSEAKPVGLVWVGFSDGEESTAQEFELPLDRSRHRMATAQIALDWVRRALLGEERVALRYLRRSR